MAQLTSSKFIQFCLQYSSLALLYYDYFLTLGREIKYIWFRKIRLSTLLYVFCRYAMLANVIFVLALTKNCNAAYQLSSALSVLGRAAIMLVWGMRTYAVFGRSRIVVAIFGTLGLFVFILAALHVPHVSCNGSTTNLVSAFTVVFEVLLTGFTTFRGIQALRAGGPWKNQRDGLVFMILEQGIIYRFVTGFTTTALVLNYAASPGSFLQKLLNGLTIPISGLMTARFLLHLREWEGRRLATSADVRTGAELETLQFARTARPRQERSLLYSLTEDFGEDPTTSYAQDTPINSD
ncbi:hypothetical protein BDQ17DRAFT_1360147 [Cyathus striatus]|nr:hypothetical protein BDQ17DRAFT_1360147 [Cyathus striatus]